MDKVIRDIRRRVELNEPLRTIDIGQIVKGDMNADRFVLELLENGKPLDLGEYSVSGVFLNAIGVDVPITGEVEGNVLTATLGRGCYEVRGMAGGFLRIANGDATVIRTVIRFTADVLSDGTGIAYDPDKVIGNIAELMAKIAAMEDATRDARLATQEVRDALGSEGNAQVAAIRQAGAEQVAAAKTEGAAQMVAIEQKGEQTRQSIPEDWTTMDADVKSLKDTKADCIRDTSAKAASHTLHAQDGPMSVTLHGATTETGSGEKSPENPYTISGVSKAEVQAGSKNLIDPNAYLAVSRGTTLSGDVFTTDFTNASLYLNIYQSIFVPKGTYTMSVIPVNSEMYCILMVYRKSDLSRVAIHYVESTGQPSSFTFTADEDVCVAIGGYYVSGNVKYGKYSYRVMLEIGNKATDYVPYNANVINPPLLPDGDPLMEGDTVENDVSSGCDKCITMDGSSDENWYMYAGLNGGNSAVALTGVTDLDASNPYDALSYSTHLPHMDGAALATYKPTDKGFIARANMSQIILISPEYAGMSVAEFRAHLAANPLKVYYRSTAYTPEKDIRVTRVTRRLKPETLNGSEAYWSDYGSIKGCTLLLPRMRPSSVTQDFYCDKYPTSKTGSFSQNSIIAGLNSSQYLYFVNCYEVFGVTSLAEWKAYLSENPLEIMYPLATPEVYYTDRHDLRKPYGLMPVTVTGSGETAVEYPHQTKHFIIDFVTKAISGSV